MHGVTLASAHAARDDVLNPRQ